MESLIIKAFQVIFKFTMTLLIGGTMVAVLTDIQKKAFHSTRTGLVSMSKINQQLVGKTK